VDGRVCLQIWGVAASMLNKQLQTVDKGWPSSLGDGWRANSSSLQSLITLQRDLEFDRFFVITLIVEN